MVSIKVATHYAWMMVGALFSEYCNTLFVVELMDCAFSTSVWKTNDK